jgi:hypothetical protein
MKKLLLTAAAILATLNIYAQGGTGTGTVSYNTTGVPNTSRVWVNDTGAVGEGTLASGAGFQSALFWGQAGTLDDRNLVQVGGSTAFLTGGAAGTFFGSGRTITGLPINGAVVTVQSRSWQVEAGVTGYSDALHSGKGPAFEMKLKDPNLATEPTPTIGLQAGWRGYAITPVPEPSVIGLGLLGAGALLLLRRRK